MNELDVATKLVKVETQCDTNTENIKKLADRQDNLDALVSTVAAMACEQDHMKDDVKEIKSDVKSLTCKSGKRWDDFMDKLIWLVCGGVLAYMLSQFLEGVK